jgi:hypothetical protein
MVEREKKIETLFPSTFTPKTEDTSPNMQGTVMRLGR